MSALTVALLTFGCIFSGAVMGIGLAAALPDHHRSGDSRDVIKLAIGMVATLSALVLGLLVATAKGTFDQQTHTLNQVATKVILLDRMLAWYGPDSQPARDGRAPGTGRREDRPHAPALRRRPSGAMDPRV